MSPLQKAISTAENAEIAEIRRGRSPLFLCDAQRSRRFAPFLQWSPNWGADERRSDA